MLKNITLLLLLTWGLQAQTTALKYAFNDPALKSTAAQLADRLKDESIHLALLENSELFIKDGGLTGVKMGYIELYGLNATELHGVIFGIWPMLDRAKAGEDGALREALSELGLELIGTKFLNNRTLLVVAHPRSFQRLSSGAQQIIRATLP